MSREILLIAGDPDPTEQGRRRSLIQQAVTRVPGWHSHQVVESAYAVAALVHTEPDGGTTSAVEQFEGGFRIGIAQSDRGLASAMKSASGFDLGAEAGHVVVHSEPSGGVRLTTDGAAFVPSYWGTVDGRLFVSTHLASMVSLGLPGDPDDQGVLEYIVLMHPWGHRTLLRHAQLLAPGGTVDWRPDRGAVTSARPLYVPSDDVMTDSEAIAEFQALWPEIVGDMHDRTSELRTVLGLSGGLDSRTIAVGAQAIGWRLLTYTYGTSRNHETRTAASVAERLQLSHLQIPIADDRLLRNAGRIIDVLDGAHSPGEMYELWFDDTLRSFADVVINGLVSGPLWGDDKTMGLTDRDAISGHLRRRFAGALAAARPFVGDGISHELPQIIGSGIDRSLEGWDFDRRRDMTLFWKQANKLLRWGSMLTNSMRRSGLRLEAPFLDHRFLRFAARLTPDQRLNGRLYLRVHREVLGVTADIERSDDGNSPARLNHVYWSGERSFAAQMAGLAKRHPVSGVRRGTRRALDVAAAQVRARTGLSGYADSRDDRASVFPAELWARTRPVYAERLAALLDSAQGATSLLSDESIGAAADALRRGRPTASPLVLSRVAAAGIWLDDYGRRAAEARTVD
jgi:asparagine synthase (glutamine-hydrolysing)